mmetsp:Transcript_3347/g.7870  ORF Transcript_3347/g.7870 Transcript_3347/m.7870 type:complete len:311 (+) Transcript_3347:593-1525(+)|eukprot:CAMPEP_0178995044 /NCGR_PEP_ID=MMETSP0795-20121207/7624_1 /TAXON_ID=88552 /ORGANISM="Amoebophrya sp., Strain Ameob2" /LENGTH=310 /DNA_ID=CAMNT_0020687339 /DNA_START=1243 /DNA_END=2175 /DNA_ORIENTATION=+
MNTSGGTNWDRSADPFSTCEDHAASTTWNPWSSANGNAPTSLYPSSYNTTTGAGGAGPPGEKEPDISTISTTDSSSVAEEEVVAQEDLCFFAWDVVLHRLKQISYDPCLPPTYNPANKAPLFVTWLKWEASGYENLRGCIGCLEPLALSPGLRDYTIKAAFEDSRFPPIQAHELPSLTCQVSVLHSFEPASHAYDWEVGKHGIIIHFNCPTTQRHYTATYLPEVAVEHEMTRETALLELVKKSGYRYAPPSGNYQHDALDNAFLKGISVTRYQSRRVRMTHEERQRLGRETAAGNLALGVPGDCWGPGYN